MTRSKPNGIILKRQYEASFSYLSNDELASLIRALFYYANTDETPEDLVPTVRAIFEMIKLDLQRDFASYEEKCRVNSENGKKGGRPRKDQESEKTERFFEKAKKANNNNKNNNKNNNNINIKEEVNNDNDADANDLAARGMVSLSSKAPPPPPKREEVLCRAEELGIPRSYAEARLERAEHFSRYEKRSEVDILKEWWEGDRRGTPKNALLSSKKEKSYDLDEFFQAALAHSYADIEVG